MYIVRVLSVRIRPREVTFSMLLLYPGFGLRLGCFALAVLHRLDDEGDAVALAFVAAMDSLLVSISRYLCVAISLSLLFSYVRLLL